ncbi:arsenate reductase family protein [Lederbergia panacisoli]|uniref:arsenate reductase family protein n=1 Tax=Lederbergia panacisoli TaxID=1255251 RepID=UPI00214B86EB|nr:arsenate reductase family protein [Lederbergia panacisoli]MCR2823103.1 arsenate reductase family protein [Lederbergia panacisoli]
MVLSFYCYPKCGTCRKAKKWLEDHQIEYNEIHIVENTPTSEEIEKIYKNSHFELKKFFNTSGMKYRELGLKDKIGILTENELFDILASDGMLIKRPLVTDGHKVTLGFKEEEFEKTWND